LVKTTIVIFHIEAKHFGRRSGPAKQKASKHNRFVLKWKTDRA